MEVTQDMLKQNGGGNKHRNITGGLVFYVESTVFIHKLKEVERIWLYELHS